MTGGIVHSGFWSEQHGLYPGSQHLEGCIYRGEMSMLVQQQRNECLPATRAGCTVAAKREASPPRGNDCTTHTTCPLWPPSPAWQTRWACPCAAWTRPTCTSMPPPKAGCLSEHQAVRAAGTAASSPLCTRGAWHAVASKCWALSCASNDVGNLAGCEPSLSGCLALLP